MQESTIRSREYNVLKVICEGLKRRHDVFVEVERSPVTCSYTFAVWSEDVPRREYFQISDEVVMSANIEKIVSTVMSESEEAIKAISETRRKTKLFRALKEIEDFIEMCLEGFKSDPLPPNVKQEDIDSVVVKEGSFYKNNIIVTPLRATFYMISGSWMEYVWRPSSEWRLVSAKWDNVDEYEKYGKVVRYDEEATITTNVAEPDEWNTVKVDLDTALVLQGIVPENIRKGSDNVPAIIPLVGSERVRRRFNLD